VGSVAPAPVSQGVGTETDTSAGVLACLQLVVREFCRQLGFAFVLPDGLAAPERARNEPWRRPGLAGVKVVLVLCVSPWLLSVLGVRVCGSDFRA